MEMDPKLSGNELEINFNYDEVWHEWDDMTQKGPFHRHVHRIIKDLIRPLKFESVCDVGCGSGTFLQELLTDFPTMVPYGIDVSAVAINLAKKKIPQGSFGVVDLTKGTFSKKADLVLCCEVLEHIKDDQVALNNIAKMTNEYLVVTTIQGKMRKWEATKVGHVRNYSHGELVEKMTRAGFNILKVVEWGFPFYSPIYRDILALLEGKGTKGKIGPTRKLIAQLIYFIFSLNSHRRGDEIIVLARVEK